MDASNLATWDSSNPWSMADFIVASGMPLDDDERRAVERAHEGGHTWSVYRLHELNVLCLEARGWLRADRERALAAKAGLPTTLRGAFDLGITDTLRLVYVAAACAEAFYKIAPARVCTKKGYSELRWETLAHYCARTAAATLETLAAYGCPVAREMARKPCCLSCSDSTSDLAPGQTCAYCGRTP